MLQKRDINVSKVFLTFMALGGDLRSTAIACNMSEEDLSVLATQENWATQLADAASLRERDQNAQITINRACSYVQACQLSNIIDAVIQKMSDPETMMELMTTTTKNGSTFSTKPLTDLVRAAEAVQGMKRYALGDSGNALEAEKVSGASISLNVARAMNAAKENAGVDCVSIVQNSLLKNDNAGAVKLPPGGVA